ncbi:MAG: SRPBCC domain-containing protein [Thermodesulfobacteriota bacterium]
MSANQVVVKKLIRAGRDEVFEAFTDPEIMTKWFYPFEGGRAEVKNSLRVGGQYSIIMFEAGGGMYEYTGEYRDIQPPERLVFTWNSNHVQGTVVTVTLAVVDGGTEVAIIHDLLPTKEARKNHSKGWTGCLNNLEKIFA